MSDLKHYGVKGMRWGVRKSLPAGKTTTDISIKKSGKVKIKTAGGKPRGASEDAVRAAVTRQRMKKGGVNALSNKELQEYTTRLNLEQNAKRLHAQNQNVAKRFVVTRIKNVGSRKAGQIADDALAKQVDKALDRRGR